MLIVHPLDHLQPVGDFSEQTFLTLYQDLMHLVHRFQNDFCIDGWFFRPSFSDFFPLWQHMIFFCIQQTFFFLFNKKLSFPVLAGVPHRKKPSLCHWSCMMKMPDDKHQAAAWYGRSAARSRRLSWQTAARATGKYTQDDNLHLTLSSFIATYSTSAFLPSLPVCHHIPPSPPCVLSWQRLGRLIIMPACL